MRDSPWTRFFNGVKCHQNHIGRSLPTGSLPATRFYPTGGERAAPSFSVWIDCSFPRALERAIARGQEGLPPADTIRAYETIYFPAQKIHFQRDDPKSAATMIFDNNQAKVGGVRLIPLTQVALDVVCREVGRVRSPGRTPDG